MVKKTLVCPICSEPVSSNLIVVISPWIRELGVASRLSRYAICDSCGTGLFSKRYNSEEMTGIYKNYRGEKYLSIRSKWEPWYSSKYNSNHDSQEWIESRKSSLTNFLALNGITSCSSIVDVGGDRGQYIPDITKEKIVFDISEKSSSSDVTRYSSFDELPFSDLIIYAHVLEHVKNPLQELQLLFQKTNCLYVEVPYGVPIINKYRKSRLRLLLHLTSSFSKTLWRRTTSPATGREVISKKMIIQSEHLTFFCEESIERLALKLNAELVLQRTVISTPDLNAGEVIQCLLTIR
jgi:hypothetical protein